MENISDKICRGNQNTHVLRNNFVFENRAIYKVICKNTVELGIIWRMRIAFLIPKATHVHSQYIILVAFLLQQWLQESA
jgi:hypothetical protein